MPWNPSDLLRNGLSTASVNQPTQLLNLPSRTLADLSGAGASPTQVMAETTGPGGSILRFPNENLMYYMKITTRKYKRSGWNTIGTSDIEKTIVLPLPMQMIDNQNVKYSTEPLGVSGALGLAGGGAIGNFKNIINDISIQSIKDSLFNAQNIGKAATNLGGGAVSYGLDQLTGTAAKVAQGALAGAGLAQNEFLTVMLEGPNYKEFDFQWVLSPNSPEETEALRLIIQVLKNAQAPTLSPLGYAFFQYPRIFEIEFKFGPETSLGDILFRTRPMVMLNGMYNYTPHGVFSPFTQTHGPNAVEMQLRFQELELWVHNSDTDLAYKDGGPSVSESPNLFSGLGNPNTNNPPEQPATQFDPLGNATGQ